MEIAELPWGHAVALAAHGQLFHGVGTPSQLDVGRRLAVRRPGPGPRAVRRWTDTRATTTHSRPAASTASLAGSASRHRRSRHGPRRRGRRQPERRCQRYHAGDRRGKGRPPGVCSRRIPPKETTKVSAARSPRSTTGAEMRGDQAQQQRQRHAPLAHAAAQFVHGQERVSAAAALRARRLV